MKKFTAMLLAALFCLTAASVAAAEPEADWQTVVQDIADGMTAPADAVRTSGPDLRWGIRPDLTWDEVTAELAGEVQRITMSVPSGMTWYDAEVKFYQKNMIAIPFYADGAMIPQEVIRSVPVTPGQHFLLTNSRQDGILAFGDVVAPSSEPGTPTATPSGPASGAIPAISAMQQEGIRLVNELRTSKGVGTLEANATLCAAAQIRANEMAATGVFSHTRPNGTDFNTVFTGATYVGENIAMRSSGPAAEIPALLMQQWVNSPGHYQNMITDFFRQMGIAYAQAANGSWYGVQIFCSAGSIHLLEPPPAAAATPEPAPSTPVPTTAPTPVPTPVPTTVPTMAPGAGIPAISPLQYEGIRLVNELRAGKGLGLLEANATLCAAAQIRANEIAATGVFSHTRPNGTDFDTVFTGASLAGENIAGTSWGTAEAMPERMMELWMDSPGHYENMIRAGYRQMGIAYAKAADGWWYGVQIFCGSGNIQLLEPPPASSETPAPTQTPSPSVPTPTSAPTPSASTARPTEPPVTTAPAESLVQPAAGSGYTFVESDGERMLLGPQFPAGAQSIPVEEVLRNLTAPAGAELEVLNADGTPVAANAPMATGMTLQLRSAAGIPMEDAVVVVKGDVLGTGRMNIAQLTALAAALNGSRPLSGARLLAADWNGSGQVDLGDLVREARVLTGQA